MRRDLDLARDILIQVGEADGPVDYEELGNGRPAALVAYHCVLMAQRGLLDLDLVRRDSGGDYVILQVNGLTWDGEDYLAAIADPGVWKRAKAEAAKVAKSVTFEVLKTAAVLIVEQQIRLNLGA